LHALSSLSIFSDFRFPACFSLSATRSLAVTARGRVVVSRTLAKRSRNLIYRYAGRFIKASAHAYRLFHSASRIRDSKARIPAFRAREIPVSKDPLADPHPSRKVNVRVRVRIARRTIYRNGIKYRSYRAYREYAHYYSRYATYSNRVGTLGCALTRVADSIARTIEITRTLVPAGRLPSSSR
jgi:hypothetical protein